MLTNPLLFLAVEQLARTAAAGVAAEDELWLLQSVLSPPQAREERDKPRMTAEERVVAAYLAAPFDELDDVPLDVHAWMLERLAVDAHADPGVARRLADSYFHSPNPVRRLLVVAALLACQQKSDAHGIATVAWSIAEDKMLSAEEKRAEADTLAQIVLDFWMADSHRVEAALRELLRIERQGGLPGNSVAAAVSARAELLGDEDGARLAGLTAE